MFSKAQQSQNYMAGGPPLTIFASTIPIEGQDVRSLGRTAVFLRLKIVLVLFSPFTTIENSDISGKFC